MYSWRIKKLLICKLPVFGGKTLSWRRCPRYCPVAMRSGKSECETWLGLYKMVSFYTVQHIKISQKLYIRLINFSQMFHDSAPNLVKDHLGTWLLQSGMNYLLTSDVPQLLTWKVVWKLIFSSSPSTFSPLLPIWQLVALRFSFTADTVPYKCAYNIILKQKKKMLKYTAGQLWGTYVKVIRVYNAKTRNLPYLPTGSHTNFKPRRSSECLECHKRQMFKPEDQKSGSQWQYISVHLCVILRFINQEQHDTESSNFDVCVVHSKHKFWCRWYQEVKSQGYEALYIPSTNVP